MAWLFLAVVGIVACSGLLNIWPSSDGFGDDPGFLNIGDWFDDSGTDDTTE
jgi:hypothetical protein